MDTYEQQLRCKSHEFAEAVEMALETRGIIPGCLIRPRTNLRPRLDNGHSCQLAYLLIAIRLLPTPILHP